MILRTLNLTLYVVFLGLNAETASAAKIPKKPVVTPPISNPTPPVTTSPITPPPVSATPPVAEVPPVNTPPEEPVVRSTAGAMEFAITPFANMEHGSHVTEAGYRAVCSDAQGVVATALMTMDAVINGQTTDGRSAYTALVVRPETQYIRQGATSGTCTSFTICSDSNAAAPSMAANCRNMDKGSASRATYYKGQGSYKVNGNTVSIQAGAPGLSAWHPAFAYTAPNKAFKDFQSPLVLDIAGRGSYNLTDVWNESTPVKFDISLTGKPVRTGWIDRGSAFLAIDLNGNGLIDNGGELFGEYSGGDVLGPRTFQNGFDALAVYDSNKDGVMDSKDLSFAKLLVWKDNNRNGKSERKELRKLSDLKIASISLKYSHLIHAKETYPVVKGNEIRYESTYTTTDGKTHKIGDVWFKQRQFADELTSHIKWLTAPVN